MSSRTVRSADVRPGGAGCSTPKGLGKHETVGGRTGLSLGTTLLVLCALLVVAGLVVLLLARTGRVRLPLYAVGALIVVLAVLIVAGLLWLLSTALAPG